MKITVNKIAKIVLGLVLFASFASCNSENENLNIERSAESKVLSFQDYFEFIHGDYDGGKVLIESNKPMLNSDNVNGIHLSKGLSKDNNEIEVFLFDGVSNKAMSKSSESLSSLFGRVVNYSIDDNNTFVKSSSNSSSQVYIPQLISAQISTTDLRAGTVVTWNVDPLNQNGLVLWYEYSPFTQDKIGVLSDNREPLIGGITIPEAGGSYTISSSDIQNLPNNATVSFYLSRAGIDATTSSSGDPAAITGVTTVSDELIVTKL